jgi:hypothetical protein
MKARYKKPLAVRELEKLAMEAARNKYPGFPDGYLAPRLYRDDNTNGLTKCICHYIQLRGGSAFRINSQGQYDPRLKKWRPSGQRKGLPDIQGTWQGRSLSIEVKRGRDKLRPDQERVKNELTGAGALYYLARDFEGFKSWFDNEIKKAPEDEAGAVEIVTNTKLNKVWTKI